MSEVSVLHRRLYGTGQAAHLLHLPAQTVRRWLDGYDRGAQHYEPVVRDSSTGEDVVTWGEFVELGLLREYRSRRVSLQKLRVVVQGLKAELGVPYPLAHVQPYVSGLDLVMRLQKTEGVPQELWMVMTRGGQLELTPMAQAFYEKVDFDADIAAGLSPEGRGSAVVISPEHGFGMPTVRGRNVRTEVLSELWMAGEPMTFIAQSHGLTVDEVEAALRYEGRSAA